MRPAKPLVLLLFFFAACASPTAVIDKRTLRCEPGQDIEIRAGVFDPAATREAPGPLMYGIEVANNSHNEVTVTYIRLEPMQSGSRQLDGSATVSRTYDQVIASGKEHRFEIPVNDVVVREPGLRRMQQREFRFSAIVALSNGDSYHCEFESRWE